MRFAMFILSAHPHHCLKALHLICQLLFLPLAAACSLSQAGVTFLFDWFVRLIGPLLLVAATILIGLIVYLYYAYILSAITEPGTVLVSYETRLERYVGLHALLLCLLGPVLRILPSANMPCINVLIHSPSVPCAAAIPLRPQRFLHGSWGAFLAFNVFWNYYHCAFVKPGNPGKMRAHKRSANMFV